MAINARTHYGGRFDLVLRDPQEPLLYNVVAGAAAWVYKSFTRKVNGNIRCVYSIERMIGVG